MSATVSSTLLANLTLQVQDDLNSGQNSVTRTVPTFTYQATSSPFAMYLTLTANQTYQLYPNLTTYVNFLYVRNATATQNGVPNQTLGLRYSQNGTFISTIQNILPGGFFVYANPSNLSSPVTGGLTDIQLISSAGTVCVVEYLYAV